MFFDSSFEFSYFTFRLRVLSKIQMPSFKGTILRSSFGKHFRRVVCMQKGTDCGVCFFGFKCPYAFIFESPRLKKESYWHASHDPHPFVFNFSQAEKSIYLPGEELCLNLLLVGEGIDYLPHFVLVFEDMGRTGIGNGRGRFEVVEVSANDLQGSKVVFRGAGRTFVNDGPRITSADLNRTESTHNRIKLHFCTPARIQKNGKIVDTIDFPLLVRAILRRYSWLSNLYCHVLPDLPYDQVLSKAEEIEADSVNLKWQKVSHFSYRQKRRFSLNGLVGSIIYEGDLAPYMPLLKLGEYIHVGKNTAFGLGKYILLEGEQRQVDSSDHELSNFRT